MTEAISADQAGFLRRFFRGQPKVPTQSEIKWGIEDTKRRERLEQENTLLASLSSVERINKMLARVGLPECSALKEAYCAFTCTRGSSFVMQDDYLAKIESVDVLRYNALHLGLSLRIYGKCTELWYVDGAWELLVMGNRGERMKVIQFQLV
jgi:hypothetical protein